MPKSTKKPIRTGVLGLGRAGWDIHVRAIRNDTRYRIVAVTDNLPDRLAQAQDELGCETFRTPKELLATARCDLIVNAMPSQFHAPLTRDAFRAGCHVAVEKPIARDVREAQTMVRAAKAAKKKLFPHHNYRFQPMVKHFREVIDSGILGEVFEFKFNATGFSRRNDWQTLKKNNGGLLNNHGTHCIDWVMQLMDSPVRDVFSDAKLVSDSGNAEDHMRVLLRAKSGCLADFHLSTATNASLPNVLILGTCGTLTYAGGESTIRYFDPKKVKPLPVDTRPPAERQYGNADKLPWREKTLKATSKDKTTFYDNVYSVVRERGKQVITPESVIEVLKVLDRARVPAKNWRPDYGA